MPSRVLIYVKDKTRLKWSLQMLNFENQTSLGCTLQMHKLLSKRSHFLNHLQVGNSRDTKK